MEDYKCKKCGTALDSSMTCRNCGTDNFKKCEDEKKEKEDLHKRQDEDKDLLK